jgi:regulation of enolase protein 1 (concanavalin A-like superfamily)
VSVPTERFVQMVGAEWTKLRTVARWVWGLVAAVVVTVLLAVASAAGSTSEQAGSGPADASGPAAGDPDIQDAGHLVHRTLAGDGSVTARVASQDDGHEWAKAGIVVRDGTARGTDYAALVVTPDHGVRLLWGYGEDRAGSTGGAPRWLRLTRSGTTVVGYESADGEDWDRVGEVELDGLPASVEAGMIVASPSRLDIERQFGSESITEVSTQGRATFDHVAVEPEDGPSASAATPGWADHDASLVPGDGASSRAGDTVTVTGSGDIGRVQFADDPVLNTLQNVVVGVLLVVAVSVLFVTAEYRSGMIRTTFAAAPRRGQALAAKALVIAAVAFVVGLVAAGGMVLLAEPPGFAPPSLSDGPVLRAVTGTGLLLALVAVLALAAGAILRRSAGAITGVVLLLVAPQVVAGALPLSTAMWLQRVTPAAGFAVQQTRTRYDTALGPWAGLGVLAAYAAVALALSVWLVRRRDA